MGPIIKISSNSEEIELRIKEAEKINEILFEIESKADKLKKICNTNLNAKVIVKVKDLSLLDIEKLKRAIIKNAEIVEYRLKVTSYDGTVIQKKKDEVKEDLPKEDIIEEKEENLGLHSIKKTFESALDVSDTKYIHTNLRSGQRIEYEGSLVIIGDLNYGAEAVAGGNIVVTGTIRGLAHAGANGNKKAIIAGHEIENTQVRIANVVKEVKETSGKLPFLYLDGEDIILEFTAPKVNGEAKSE